MDPKQVPPDVGDGPLLDDPRHIQPAPDDPIEVAAPPEVVSLPGPTEASDHTDEFDDDDVPGLTDPRHLPQPPGLP